uniref:Baculoviral IAP repeat-containing protein n=1 Tax=Penaeus semisulcatus majanivirus TaxID=2984274 RepID=A0A9C7EYF1_9VIRU|nr:MAG: baculoviral IAP repeat-containing protein [Penaeus semisulcatus majanivirus]
MDVSHPNSFLQQEEYPLTTFSEHETSPIDTTRVYRNMPFVSYDCLRYEEKRLGTFIDWPHEWLKPSELAADGFYYLRKDDHCACIFCRGIVGAWEKTDTPRGEHQRHFPHCPFIRGKPTGNVPIVQGNILARLPVIHASLDDCGSRRVEADDCRFSSRHMAGSYPECRGSPDETGLYQHSGPKRSDFATLDSRLKSYVEGWPILGLHAQDLAEAGFFYCVDSLQVLNIDNGIGSLRTLELIASSLSKKALDTFAKETLEVTVTVIIFIGLSDHVRCFHCGKGLRNWISSDIPWKEHARWYPRCRFVLLTKGQDYIDEVQQEYPPYTRTAGTVYSGIDKAASGSSNSPTEVQSISERDLDQLMSLDIVKCVLEMGYPSCIVRACLKDRVEQTGDPYFVIEPCLKDVIQRMSATENRVADNRSDSTEREPSYGETDISSSIFQQQAPISPSTSETMGNRVAGIQSLPSESTEVELSSQQQQQQQQVSILPSTSEIIRQQASIFPTAPMNTTLSSSERENTETEANHILRIVEEIISQTSEEEKEEYEEKEGYEEKEEFESRQSYEQLKEELERMREDRTCKVCMDSEITIVFLPCSHMVTCVSCAVSLRQCPICRRDIKHVFRAIVS